MWNALLCTQHDPRNLENVQTSMPKEQPLWIVQLSSATRRNHRAKVAHSIQCVLFFFPIPFSAKHSSFSMKRTYRTYRYDDHRGKVKFYTPHYSQEKTIGYITSRIPISTIIYGNKESSMLIILTEKSRRIAEWWMLIEFLRLIITKRYIHLCSNITDFHTSDTEISAWNPGSNKSLIS